MTKPKTSTFVIDHEACDLSKWTLQDWAVLAEYMATGSLSIAAGLARRGVKLVRDDRHEATGGTVEQIGWLEGSAGAVVNDAIADVIDDLDPDAHEVVEVVPIYRGQTRYAVKYFVGNEAGDVDGSEIDTFETEEEAKRFADSLQLAAT